MPGEADQRIGMLAERAAYARRGLADRVAAVDAELRRRGWDADIPQDRKAPEGETAAPTSRRSRTRKP